VEIGGFLALGRLVLGSLLVVAGLATLRSGQARFSRRIYAYELIPRRAAWVLARATPNVKPGHGAIDWIITLNGDAIVTAVDASGNVSAPSSCKVPPPPK